MFGENFFTSETRMSNPQPVRKQNSKLEGLEAGRGVAAMMVLLYHCALHCKNVFGQFALGQLFAFGHAGVDFFFVLSGFIIFHAHRQDFGRADRLGRYVERRVTRIYPLYWIVLAATLFVALFSHHPFPTFEHVIVSALLSPTVGGIIVVDAWTLQHEMVFYTVFALAVFNRRLGFAVFAAWFLFLIVCTQMSVKWESGLLSKLSSYFNFEFFIGMAAAWLAGRGGVAWPRVCALLGVAGFLAVGAGEDLGLWPALNIFTHAGYGVSAMLIVLGLVSWERRSGLAVPRTLARLGDASYSIYLVHVLTIGIIWQAIQRLGIADNIAPFGLFAILAAVATSVGLVVSIYAEKPLLRVLRSRRRRGLEPEVVAVG